MEKPKISVLMPVYNSERFLSLSIKSVLDQSFKDFEFIIVDDASTDSSWRLISNYQKEDRRVVALRNKQRLGTTSALNKGLRSAKGKYIVRMDADDFSYPDRLEKQYLFMESHKDVGVSGGTVEVCDEKLNIRYARDYPADDLELRKIIFLYSPFAHPATIWRKQLLIGLGGYNENFPFSQDAELYFRLGTVSKFANIKDTLIKLRMHINSSSVSKNIAQEKYAIYARIKGIMEYGYKAGFTGWLYIFIRLMAMFIIPTKMKFWIFNFLRRKR